MKYYGIFILLSILIIAGCKKNEGNDNHNLSADVIIANHECTKLSSIPAEWIESAKQNLHIAYGHRSNGSQLTPRKI